MKYSLNFYHPNFMDIDDPPVFQFNSKKELLNNKEIKRVGDLDYHVRWEQITRERHDKRTTLMHICKGKNGEEFWVKAFISPALEDQWFPEWKYKNYREKA